VPVITGALTLLFVSAVDGAAAPELDRLFPAGGRQGTTFHVTAEGRFSWPVQVWVDGPGITASALPQAGRLSVQIDAGAPPGVRWVRLFNGDGASAPRPLVVGTLAEMEEREPNDRPALAQRMPSAAITVNGRLQSEGDVDVFAVALERGQTLVASLDAARSLEAPMDATLEITNEAGIVLAQNDDEAGLDPRLVFTAPARGVYGVRLFAFPSVPTAAIRLAGGEAYVYRLTLTTAGVLDYVFPLAIEAGQATSIELRGWNLPLERRTLTLSPPEAQASLDVFVPEIAGLARVRVEPHRTVAEREPNGPLEPQTIELPVTVSGRIGEPGDVDTFCFQARENQTLVFRVESQSLGFPLDATLRLADADDNECQRIDDVEGRRDPDLMVSIPLDGEYRLTIRDLYRHGGPRHVYRLTVASPEPDFALTVTAHSFTAQVGQPLEIPVTIERREGFAEELTLAIEGLPAEIAAEAVHSSPDSPSAQSVRLRVLAPAVWSGPIRIVGRSPTSTKQHRAETEIPGFGVPTANLWLTVTPVPR
jgi:hypothetical protein